MRYSVWTIYADFLGDDVEDTLIHPSCRTHTKHITKEPKLFRVIYMNDDKTTMEFVIESLVTVFRHSPESAAEVTEKIHSEGSGVAAVLPFEMAEQRGLEVTKMARDSNFPLQLKLEQE